MELVFACKLFDHDSSFELVKADSTIMFLALDFIILERVIRIYNLANLLWCKLFFLIFFITVKLLLLLLLVMIMMMVLLLLLLLLLGIWRGIIKLLGISIVVCCKGIVRIIGSRCCKGISWEVHLNVVRHHARNLTHHRWYISEECIQV